MFLPAGDLPPMRSRLPAPQALGRISKLWETVADAALRRPGAVQARHEPRSGPVRPLDAGGVVAARQPLPTTSGGAPSPQFIPKSIASGYSLANVLGPPSHTAGGHSGFDSPGAMCSGRP